MQYAYNYTVLQSTAEHRVHRAPQTHLQDQVHDVLHHFTLSLCVTGDSVVVYTLIQNLSSSEDLKEDGGLSPGFLQLLYLLLHGVI